MSWALAFITGCSIEITPGWVDGDGRADVLIGVPGEDTIFTDEGAVLIGISQYE